MKTQNKKKYVHIRIEEKIKYEFEKICEGKLITPSKLIRKLIVDYINQEK